MKTSELTGAALNWAVAVAEFGYGADSKTNKYSTDWTYGGPIIERANISIERNVKMQGCAVIGFHDWHARHPRNYGGLIRYHGYGNTLLIAAMRCYVASELGDEVEIPAELINQGE